MNYYLYKKDFQIYKNDFYILPTAKIFVNNPMYIEKNFAIEFHFLIFHARLLFEKKQYIY